MDYAAYILITIAIIVILVWIYIRFDSQVDQYELIRQQQVNETVQWLHQAVNDICHTCNMFPLYEIRETSQITYTEKTSSSYNVKGIIYLVVWDETHSRLFNHNTLIYAILHEISHILSPSIHHEPPFDTIETVLLNTATNLGYYDPNIPMESHYMTLDLTSTIRKTT